MMVDLVGCAVVFLVESGALVCKLEDLGWRPNTPYDAARLAQLTTGTAPEDPDIVFVQHATACVDDDNGINETQQPSRDSRDRLRGEVGNLAGGNRDQNCAVSLSAPALQSVWIRSRFANASAANLARWVRPEKAATNFQAPSRPFLALPDKSLAIRTPMTIAVDVDVSDEDGFFRQNLYTCRTCTLVEFLPSSQPAHTSVAREDVAASPAPRVNVHSRPTRRVLLKRDSAPLRQTRCTSGSGRAAPCAAGPTGAVGARLRNFALPRTAQPAGTFFQFCDRNLARRTKRLHLRHASISPNRTISCVMQGWVGPFSRALGCAPRQTAPSGSVSSFSPSAAPPCHSKRLTRFAPASRPPRSLRAPGRTCPAGRRRASRRAARCTTRSLSGQTAAAGRELRSQWGSETAGGPPRRRDGLLAPSFRPRRARFRASSSRCRMRCLARLREAFVDFPHRSRERARCALFPPASS
ncbi:hypothetical protein C8Q78DRAFT_808216 [Trametes maxima]|nr:hypothetical protein C8Q78DRAFT_808216 [Trametes maxima]